MKTRLYVLIAVLVSALYACSDSPATEPEQENNPAEQPGGSQDEDSGDEQERKVYFTNPVINSDVPDICITRAGEDYYMVSTTMYFMPGAPIMHSKDLVSWKIIGYVFDSLDESEANNLEQNGDGESDIYAKGQWASSIRYHDGWFYVMFATGFGHFNHTYIYKTQDPAGKWQLAQKFDEILHDSSLFFEDDGTPFIITFDGEIIELDKDLAIKTRNFGKLNMNIEQGVQCEGCQFFKVDGKYYAFFMYRPGGIRKVLCLKSNSLTGYYSQRVVLDDSGIAQGGIIDTPDGKWYGYFFQDMWPLGRCPYLVPCTWDGGWPVMGDENGDVPREMEVPVNTGNLFPRSEVLVNDDFDSEKLGLTWQWNHNPDNSLWSLTERPGYMRLKTRRVMADADDIFHAPNTLTQRTIGDKCSGWISIDVSNMKDGDRAGLSVFGFYGGLVEVVKENGKYELSMSRYNQKIVGGKETNVREDIDDTVELTQDVVYLKADCDFVSSKAIFYYSLDGYKWNRIGGETTLIYTLMHFTGYRFGIFNYATQSSGGYVDIDYFEYKKL
ncbi:glycoside hydrolase 43 family protein [uncultured Bacteroides sp.]|uniref:glycoside hydrolase family 43 protein n=1 Tax=uncultured Bacteroides sp. TaxID=162156 RepID=UPI002614959F|nr:glycoside hydrolase 43 family protein [uncultured Bacteroides sp.]